MKRIISFVLCLSMLISMLPMNVFAAAVDETMPVTEASQEATEAAATEAPVVETTAAATEAPEVTTEEATEPAQTESEATKPEKTVTEDTYEEFTWVPDLELPSDEELFAGYVQKTLYGSGASLLGFSAGNTLTGDTRLAYNAFRSLIEEIAAGERDSAVLTVGASSSADYRVNFSGTSIPDGLLSDLFYALLADLPYELYWFDKTMGVGGSYGTSGGKLFVTLNFAVSAHYSADGTAGTCDLDTGKTGAAAAAAANAQAIVDEYANASDYEKLKGYKDKICSLTSYNDPAASSSYTGGYGDPWQLIWVFDGVPSTKVVCEGYSKAFQYLCDLSDFDADITCYNVQGYMDGGGHMWNIVTINGSSYLVDVTNSDQGTIGYNGKLFLVGGSGSADSGYTFANTKFVYNSETKALWGTGADSILTLATSNFDPDSLIPSDPEPTPPEDTGTMTGEELQALLNAASGQFFLDGTVEISSPVVIPDGMFLSVNGESAITVKDGGSITIPYRAALGVANGGTLTVEAGGTVTVEASGSFAVGGGTTVTIAGRLVNNGSMDITYGTVNVSGTYSGTGLVKHDQYATVTGIDTKLIQLYSYVYDEAALIGQLVPHEGYAATIVYLMCPDSNYDGIVDGPVTITRNLVVPEGVQLNLGYFTQNDQFILSDGASLTVNGVMSIMSFASLVIHAGGKLVNNNHIANFGTITNNGIFKGNGGFQQSGTFTGNDPLTGSALILDNFLESVAAAEATGSDLAVWDEITLAEDLTINMRGMLSFADYAKLTVPSGVTLTLNCPVMFNNAQLLVEAGGKLVSNVDLTVNAPNNGMGSATINGELENHGSLWVNTGSTATINGTAVSYGMPIHVGFGEGGTLIVNGSLTTYGYLNIVDQLKVNNGGTLTIGGTLFDENGEPYTNGYLQANGTVTVDGTLNATGGVTAGAALNIGKTGVVNIAPDNMWFDVTEGAVLTNEGTVTNNCFLNVYGTIVNYGTFHNNGRIRLFDTGTYDSESGIHNGNVPVDGAAARLEDFLNDLEDGGGAELYRDSVTLADDLTISLGQDHLVLRDGAALIVPNGVTLTINSHVQVEEGSIVVEEGGQLILNTNVNVISAGALGCIIVEGHMTIHDGGTLWLDNGGSLEIYGNGVVDVIDDPATQDVGAAIHVAHLSDGGTVLVEGTLNTSGYVNVTPGGWFTLNKGGTLNILNNATGCGYLDVTGMAQLHGTVNQYGLLSVSNGNGTDEFVPATARIEVYGTLTGFDTSGIYISPNASISISPSGLLETTGEVIVEKDGTLWVDGDAMFSGPAPVTNYGSIHVNHFQDDSDYNGCLILDCQLINYGYLCVNPSGTMYVNGRLDIAQTLVEDVGYAGYLNNFGNVIINGLVNNSALMDVDGNGYIRINDGALVNVQDNIVMAVGPRGEMIIDGSLNLHTGAYMEVYNAISGSGTWENHGTVHFGAYTDEETSETFIGSAEDFTGEYIHGEGAVLEVELYEGAPIHVDLIYAGLQELVYSGTDINAIRTVLANRTYKDRVIITEALTLDNDLVVGINGVLVVDGSLTIPNNVTLTAYGPVIVSGALNVDSQLKLYHPGGTLTISEEASAAVDGVVVNGTSATVHGQLVINGQWAGYAPTVSGNGTVTGAGAPSAYDMFLTLIREATAGGYPAVLDFDLTIPEYTDLSCDLIVAEGATLTLDGNLAVWGSLTVEAGAALVNNNGLSREHTGTITIADGSYRGSGTVYNACMTAEDYDVINGIPMEQQTLLVMMCTTEAIIRDALPLTGAYESATLLVRHDITLTEDLEIPENVTLRLYREWAEDGSLIPANFTVPENVTVTNNGTFQVDEHSTLIINGSWSGKLPVDNGGIIQGDFTKLAIGVLTKVQPSFIENPGTAEEAPGLWAGAKTAFSPTLYRMADGEPMDAGTVGVSFSEGAEDYAKIVQKDGLITVTANSNLTSHQIITFTFTADGAEPTTVTMHLRPKAAAADVLLDGAVVTNQTILADLNRGDTGFRLSASGSPADAVPENGTLYNGDPLVIWKSSAPAIATVDDNGYVTFTGEKTGKVKITMTANYGAKKAAVVTFNVAALPQEILASASNPTVLVGGSSGTYTATDAQGTVLKNTAVAWFLCDEAGNAIASHPYASITAAGKLTTKAVADDINVYLMAQVIGDETSALLAQPVCVTLYPAINSVHIMTDEISVNNMTLLYDIAENGMRYQLGWFAEPYMEAVQSVSWKSSKAAVADIDQNGLITVASENASGTVKFTLTVVALGGKKSTATVTMKFGTFTKSLDLAVTLPDGTAGDLKDLTVYGGETLTFSGSCVPANVSTDGIIWSLKDKTYGSITNKGVLKTKAVNNPTDIIVLADSKDGYCGREITVTLLPKQIATDNGMTDALVISNLFGYITKTTQSMMPGDAMQLYVNGDVTWMSSNTAVATVDDAGYLEALANGTATITATAADGRTATFTLKVTKMSIAVDITTKKGEPLTVASGKSLDLVGTVTFSDGSTDKKVTWSVSNTSVATISSSGKLAAAKGLIYAETVRVYAVAKDGNRDNWVDVLVVPMTTAIEIFGPSGNGGIEDVTNTTVTWDMLNSTSFPLSAKVFPAGAMEDVTWKSSAPKVADIDAKGNVTCLKSGTVTITATAKDGSGKKATFKLTVKKTMEYLQLPETAFLGGGKSLTLTKLDGYAIDPLATNQTLNWSMTYTDGNDVPKTVAALSNKGVLSTKAVTQPVDLFIRAEATDGSGCVAECTVTVCPLTTSVSIVNAPEQLYISSSVDLDVVCNPNGAAQEVTWKSSSPAVATVDADGVVTALKSGTVTITATAADGSGKKATAKIKVTDAPAVPPVTPPVTPASTEISLWTYPIGGWGNPHTVNNLVSAFEAETGIKVKVEYLTYADGDIKVDTAIEAGVAPDLILEGPERLVANWGARGKMVNIAGMFDSTDKREIYPNVLNACYADANTAYMYPVAMTTHCMAINKTVFEAAGAMQYIDEETHTWKSVAAFEAAIAAVYAYTNSTVGAVFCGGQGGDQGTRALVTNLGGGSYTNAQHTAYTWNSQENINALKKLYDMPGIEFDSAIVGGDEIALFYNGIFNVAFCWNIAQQLNPCSANTGANRTANGDEILFMAFPSDGDVQLQGGIWGFGIFDNGNTAKIEAAKTFLAYFCDSEAAIDAVKASTYFPVRHCAGGGADLSNIWADNAVMKEYDKLSPLLGDYYQVTPHWAEARTNWWNMLQLVGMYGYSEEMITAIVDEYTAWSNLW